MARRSRYIALISLALLAALPADAQSGIDAPQPSLTLPLDCTPGRDCWVLNYVDTDPGPGVLDYACGRRTNDGHKGTDIAIRDLAAMARGVEVRAAAPGLVKSARDGMRDVNVGEIGRTAIVGRECGNGVLIDNGGDWQTQYCHMRRGSIAVKPGDRVAAGDVLGLVGLSGLTEFPHLHIGVRESGVVVDPFAGLGRDPGDCGPGPRPLWDKATLAALAYRAFEPFNAGFAGAVPEWQAVRRGEGGGKPLPRLSEALVLWMEIFGVAPDDILRFRITAPDGRTVLASERRLDRRQSLRFAYSGIKRKGGPWPAGIYRGEVSVTRIEGGAETTRSLATEVEIR